MRCGFQNVETTPRGKENDHMKHETGEFHFTTGCRPTTSDARLLLQQGDCLHNGFALLLLVILTKLVLAILPGLVNSWIQTMNGMVYVGMCIMTCNKFSNGKTTYFQPCKANESSRTSPSPHLGITFFVGLGLHANHFFAGLLA